MYVFQMCIGRVSSRSRRSSSPVYADARESLILEWEEEI